MHSCITCGAPARQRIGTRGPHPKRCQKCHDELHAERLASVKTRVKNSPWTPRTCCICGADIPRTRSKRATTCSEACQKARIAAYQSAHHQANREQHRLDDVDRRYGLSPAEYSHLVDMSGGRCAICRTDGGEKLLAVDHHHATGVVRGLLCQNCNVMLGMAKEDPEILTRGAEYLLSTASRYVRENPVA